MSGAPWRIGATPGSAWGCAYKGFFVWAELCILLIGLAKAGVPVAFVVSASVLCLVYLGWRGFSAQVSFDGEQLVRIRNGLRSYTVPVASIVGASVVCSGKMPPRLALKVGRDGRTRVIALDGTARMTRKGRRQVVGDLCNQTIFTPAVLLTFSTFQF